MAYIWGRQPVREAFLAGVSITKVLVAAGAKPTGTIAEIVSLARDRRVPLTAVSSDVLNRLSEGGHHQGVIAAVPEFRYTELEDLLDRQESGEPALLLALDHLVDPQNFGTLLRAAEAVGVHGVIVPRERSAGVTPGVVKASAGAVLHLAVAQVVNLPRALEFLKSRGVWVIGLDALATVQYDKADYGVPLVLVVGSEERGLSRLVREKCDILVRLPMRGKVASLNAATAGSILLYEIFRQRLR